MSSEKLFKKLNGFNSILTKSQIDELELFFKSLNKRTKNKITISKISKVLVISSNKAHKILQELLAERYLEVCFVVECPNCGRIHEKFNSINDLDKYLKEHSHILCDNDNCGYQEISLNNIEAYYEVKDEYFFNGSNNKFGPLKKDRDKVISNTKSESFGELFIEKKDGKIIFKDLDNTYFYSPSEEKYGEMEKALEQLDNTSGTSTDIGNRLEYLVELIFSEILGFRVSRNIKTRRRGNYSVNDEIDIFITNYYNIQEKDIGSISFIKNETSSATGLINKLGYRILCECKNLNTPPTKDQLSRFIHLIDKLNANKNNITINNDIRLGIFVSKEKAPAGFEEEIRDDYLLSNGSKTIILFNKEDLKMIVKDRINVLDLIDEKIQLSQYGVKEKIKDKIV